MIFCRKNNDILCRAAGGGWEPPSRTGAVFCDLFLCINVELRSVTGETMGSRVYVKSPSSGAGGGISLRKIVSTLYPIFGRFAEGL